jgi:hypothetical protein
MARNAISPWHAVGLISDQHADDAGASQTRCPRGPSVDDLAHQPRSASRTGAGSSSTLMPWSKIARDPDGVDRGSDLRGQVHLGR